MPSAFFLTTDINHPGALSGIHGYNQWQIDDSAAQLRMRLASSRQTSHIAQVQNAADPAHALNDAARHQGRPDQPSHPIKPAGFYKYVNRAGYVFPRCCRP